MKCSFGVRPSPFWAIVRSSLYAVCVCLLPLTSAFAWLYPEHRDITLLAINTLGPDRRAVLEKLWSEARTVHETRLCASTANTEMGSKPECLDYASWPAIAGDHSCCARDMLSTVLGAPWILGVSGVGAKLDKDLAAAQRPDQRINAVRRSDIRLLRFDPDLVARAQTSTAHFLLARADSSMTSNGVVCWVLSISG